MTVFEPRPVDGYQWVLPVDSHEHRRFRRMRGQRLSGSWSPVQMYLLHEDEGERFQRADMPWLGRNLLVLTRRAKEVLGDLLAADCELLPLACDEEDLWLVNPAELAGAFDDRQSEFKRFSSSGRIMSVSKYAFHAEVLAGHRIFRIPEQTQTYVTDDIVIAIEEARLSGVRFVPVWRDP